MPGRCRAAIIVPAAYGSAVSALSSQPVVFFVEGAAGKNPGSDPNTTVSLEGTNSGARPYGIDKEQTEHDS